MLRCGKTSLNYFKEAVFFSHSGSPGSPSRNAIRVFFFECVCVSLARGSIDGGGCHVRSGNVLIFISVTSRLFNCGEFILNQVK